MLRSCYFGYFNITVLHFVIPPAMTRVLFLKQFLRELVYLESQSKDNDEEHLSLQFTSLMTSIIDYRILTCHALPSKYSLHQFWVLTNVHSWCSLELVFIRFEVYQNSIIDDSIIPVSVDLFSRTFLDPIYFLAFLCFSFFEDYNWLCIKTNHLSIFHIWFSNLYATWWA